MNQNFNTSSFEEIKDIFESTNPWGLLSSVDLKNCNSDLIRSKEAITDYVIRLCDLIRMKRFMEPQIVYFGEDESAAGYSLTQLIETSLVSGHFVNINNSAYIDVFSCKLYNPHDVSKFTKEFFKAEGLTVSILFRQ